jgi:ADP-L-glycero-D-manno-heptose 6-epimerase
MEKFKEYYDGKNIVVTGGTGFIGSNIVNKLLKYPINHIYIFDRTLKKTWDTNKITYIKGNLLTDLHLLKEIKFDIMFHEAANVNTTCIDKKNMIDTNYIAFIKIINICIQNNAKLIYASSAAVYGNNEPPNTVGINEEPLNIYGESKLMMDEYIRNNNFNIPIIGLRYFNVYGNGEEHKQSMMSMVNQMINKIKLNQVVNLFKYGEQKRDFVFVKDVVNCNLLAGISTKTGIYNCGFGEAINFNDIFSIIYNYYKNDSKINYIDNHYAFFQKYTLSNIDTTKKELGYEPKYNINKSIEKIIK